MLSRTHYRYFRILHDAAGQMVSSQAICSAIYGDQKRSRQLVSVTICNLRKAIVPLGFEIIASNGIGYGLAEARK
jgi:DNA-binding response OmpR family regulator